MTAANAAVIQRPKSVGYWPVLSGQAPVESRSEITTGPRHSSPDVEFIVCGAELAVSAACPPLADEGPRPVRESGAVVS